MNGTAFFFSFLAVGLERKEPNGRGLVKKMFRRCVCSRSGVGTPAPGPSPSCTRPTMVALVKSVKRGRGWLKACGAAPCKNSQTPPAGAWK
jgi:hypothetical protein